MPALAVAVAVVSSDDMHEATERAIVARITDDEQAADTGVSVPLPVGFALDGWIRPDTLLEVRQDRLGEVVGELPPPTVAHLDVALAVVLGLTPAAGASDPDAATDRDGDAAGG